jgi:hypothetical protein
MKYRKYIFISFICIILLGSLIYKLIQRDSQYTHIEKVIKKHNSIQKSPENLTYPLVSKPASSQIGMVGGDSVRVINNKIINNEIK